MDDDDFLAIIAVLETRLRDADAGDIADPRHYLDRDPETGEARMPEPRKRLIEMLLAFDRFLAVRDRQTFKESMESLRRSLGRTADFGLQDVVVVSDDVRAHPVSLSETPDLSELRSDLQRLVGQLIETPYPPRPTGFL